MKWAWLWITVAALLIGGLTLGQAPDPDEFDFGSAGEETVAAEREAAQEIQRGINEAYETFVSLADPGAPPLHLWIRDDFLPSYDGPIPLLAFGPEQDAALRAFIESITNIDPPLRDAPNAFEFEPEIFCGYAEGTGIPRGDGGSGVNAIFPRPDEIIAEPEEALALVSELWEFENLTSDLAIVDEFDLDNLRTAIVALSEIIGTIDPEGLPQEIERLFTHGHYASTWHGDTVAMHLLILLHAALGIEFIDILEDFGDGIVIEVAAGGEVFRIGFFHIPFWEAGAHIVPVLERVRAEGFEVVNLSWSFVPCTAAQAIWSARSNYYYGLLHLLKQLGGASYQGAATEFYKRLFKAFTDRDLEEIGIEGEDFAVAPLQALYTAYFATYLSSLDNDPLAGFEIYAASGNQGFVFALMPAAFENIVCVSAEVVDDVRLRPLWANFGERALVGGYFPLPLEAAGSDSPLDPYYAGTTYASVLAALQGVGHGPSPENRCGW